MRVAVTGGAGFIGGHVVDQLLRVGHEPVIFDHRARSQRRLYGEPGGRAWMQHDEDMFVPVMIGDTRDETAVTELAAHVDGIIHLASVLGTQETVMNPRPAVTTNVISGMNVFEAGVQYDVPVVNICVGNHGMSNPYSASKTCVETLGQMYVRDRGLALNQVRVVNAYGPRQLMAAPFGVGKVRKIMPAFIGRALTGAPIEVYGNGHQVSDCVHVSDVARALVRALEYARTGQVLQRVVEVGPTDHTSVRAVAELVQDSAHMLGFDQPENPLVQLPMRPGETPGARVVADPTTLVDLGMSVADFTSLETGIHETVEWYAKNWLPGYLSSRG
jgi:nucleoside-diphosphate-sugar epimerase